MVYDQVGPVELRGFEGMSAVDECTESLGGMETPEPLVVTQIPSVVTSVVSRCVHTSVVKCVLQRAHSVGARACVRATACVTETPCVEETPCVSGVVAGVPKCVLPSTPCAKETPCVKEETPCVRETTCVSSMARVSEQPCVSEARCVR